MTAPRLELIAAVARNGVIGVRDTLPWRLPSDLRHFKANTLHRPVLMGRKTFASLPGPLAERSVIVVSRDPGFEAPGAVVVHSLDEALDVGRQTARALQAPAVMVAGGGALYAALIGLADVLRITEVELEPAGDTLFPPIDAALWRLVDRQVPAPAARDEAPFAFLTYERRDPPAPSRL